MSEAKREAGADAVIVLASFRPLAGKAEELHRLLSWMVENTRREPGCERYDLYRQAGPPEMFHLFERYRSDDALQEHRAADHYIEYRRQVPDLIEGSINVLLLQEVDAAG
jgi:quinol monooxygenase YgiN